MTTLETLLLDPDMAGVWNLAPDRSTITFKIRNMWGLLRVKGRFTEFSGDGQLTGPPIGGAVYGRLDIRAASLRRGSEGQKLGVAGGKFLLHATAGS